jgi:hypothetical protein
MGKSGKNPLEKKPKESGNKVTSWFKGYGKATSEEFQSRIGSSIKRIIKFIGLAIIPVLYGVVCLLAFWNPVPNIGKANVTFIDQEGEVLLATHSKIDNLEAYQVYENKTPDEKQGKYEFMSTLLELNAAGEYVQNNTYNIENKDDYANTIEAWVHPKEKAESAQYSVSSNYDYTTSNGTVAPGLGKNKIKNIDVNYVYCLSGFEFLVASGIVKPSNGDSITPGDKNFKSAEDVTFETDELSSQKIAFKNIHYQKWSNKGESTWHSYKSNLQLKISSGFARSIFDVISYYYYNLQVLWEQFQASMSDNKIDMGDLIKLRMDLQKLISDQMPRLLDNNFSIWTTFARNFIFGYYINTIYEFKEAIPVQAITKIISQIDFENSEAWQQISQLVDLDSLEQTLNDLKGIVNFEIEGADNGFYGIGLGEFFLLIGLYVGTLVHTFVFDRAKRGGAKITHSQWYFSKLTLMAVTGFVQVTLLVLLSAAAGWSRLGVDRLFELWGALLLIDFTFKVTIQSIWFCIKDETIGKFLCIIYMILNLSSGWGTFPSFMQYGFFHGVSYITEFTYSLHLMGIVIYGGNYSGDWIYAIQQVGILIAFIAVFMAFGFGMSILRNREMHFGTYRKKHLVEGFKALGHTDLANDFEAKGWKGIPNDVVMDDMVNYMRINHPFEKQFKRFKEGNHPRPIKPNYTDDDIMTRNDDTLV